MEEGCKVGEMDPRRRPGVHDGVPLAGVVREEVDLAQQELSLTDVQGRALPVDVRPVGQRRGQVGDSGGELRHRPAAEGLLDFGDFPCGEVFPLEGAQLVPGAFFPAAAKR